jgi:hypothetical protein
MRLSQWDESRLCGLPCSDVAAGCLGTIHLQHAVDCLNLYDALVALPKLGCPSLASNGVRPGPCAAAAWRARKLLGCAWSPLAAGSTRPHTQHAEAGGVAQRCMIEHFADASCRAG